MGDMFFKKLILAMQPFGNTNFLRTSMYKIDIQEEALIKFEVGCLSSNDF